MNDGLKNPLPCGSPDRAVIGRSGDDRTDIRSALALAVLLAVLGGCATVKVEAPDKPIEINLNVNIQQEVRVRLEREIEDLIKQNPDIF